MNLQFESVYSKCKVSVVVNRRRRLDVSSRVDDDDEHMVLVLGSRLSRGGH
jgi:hypothetical protein